MFEAEYLKLEIENNLLRSLKEPILTANEIFKTNISLNLHTQVMTAPVRRSNWDKISAISEVFPEKFAEAMRTFGQKLIDKAKLKLVPK